MQAPEPLHQGLVYTSESFPAEHYFVRHDSCGSDILVITFERAGGKQVRPNPNRPGWGSQFIRKKEFDGLYIMPAFVDWYRQPSLVKVFRFLKLSGFFERYKRVVTYGSSMGGYAALLFSEIIRPDAIVAFNPQTTLDKAIVPWENRFDRGLVQDWSGTASDACNTIWQEADVTVVVDPFNTRDMRHARRLLKAAPDIRLLKVPFGGHETANALRDLGAISTISEKLLRGTFEPQEFYAAVRDRRQLEGYRKRLEYMNTKRLKRNANRVIRKARNQSGKENRIPGEI